MTTENAPIAPPGTPALALPHHLVTKAVLAWEQAGQAGADSNDAMAAAIQAALPTSRNGAAALVERMTAHACADWCCAKGCPGAGNSLCEHPPCDGTACTCGAADIRAVAEEAWRARAVATLACATAEAVGEEADLLRAELTRAEDEAQRLRTEIRQVRTATIGSRAAAVANRIRRLR
jgi:hypothetical protein